MQGYSESGRQFESEKARQLEAGRRQAELGRYEQAGRLGDIEQLMAAGQAKQGHAQNVANEARQEFYRQAYFPFQQVQNFASTLSGVPQAGITSSATYNPPPLQPHVNMAGNIGAAAAGLWIGNFPL